MFITNRTNMANMVNMENMVKVTIHLPKPLKNTIKKDAIDNDSTMNNTILKIVGGYYAR